MRRTSLFLAAAAAPTMLLLAFPLLFAVVPVGCGRSPAGQGKWADPPPALTPEPPSPNKVAESWDASVPPPLQPFREPLPIDRVARKPKEVIGDRRFYCPNNGSALALSLDGRLLACGGGDPYVVYLFEPDTGKEIGRLYGPSPGHVRTGRLVFSPDSKRLYAPVAVWDMATRRGLARLPSPDWDLTADGTQLVMIETVGLPWLGPPDGPVPAVFVSRRIVRVLDTRTWAEVEAFAATGMGPEVAISPDGRYIALGGEGGVVRVWDRKDHKELPSLPALSEKMKDEPAHFRREVTRLVFSPDGKTLAGASGGVGLVTGLRHVALWNWPTGTLAHKLPVASERDLVTVAFTPDSRYVVATGNIRTFAWEVATGTVRGERDIHKHGWVHGPAAVAPSGKWLFTIGPWWRLRPVGMPDLVLVTLDPPLPEEPPKPTFETFQHPDTKKQDGPGWKLPDGTSLRRGGVSRDESFGVLHLDAEGKRIRYYLERNVVGYDVTLDGKLLATYGHDDTPGAGRELPLQFWDLATGAKLASVPVSTPKPFTYLIRFSPDGKRLAMLHSWGLVRVWDVAKKKPVLSLDADGVAVSDLIYSADGRFLVGTGGSGPAVVWEATGGE